MRWRIVAVVGALVGAGLFVAPTTTAAVPSIVHAPRIPVIPAPTPGLHAASVNGWAAKNWSGYARAGSGFTAVTGHWTVPTVGATRRSTFSSSWVGIDGFDNSSLIQAGTEQDWIGGAPSYSAWWEILPAPETLIPSSVVAVHPGDKIAVSITRGVPKWTITLTDTTTGRSFSTQQAYAGPRASVEWIQESPFVGNHLAKLATFSTTPFDPGTINGVSAGLVASESGVLVRGRRQLATPSVPDSDTDGFAVAYGAIAPPPPAS